MGKRQRKVFLYLLAIFETLWTLDVLSIWIMPQTVLYEFERPYYMATHVVDIKPLRGIAIEEDEAVFEAQQKTIPYAVASVAALITVLVAVFGFKHRARRRACWMVSCLIMLLMFFVFLF